MRFFIALPLGALGMAGCGSSPKPPSVVRPPEGLIQEGRIPPPTMVEPAPAKAIRSVPKRSDAESEASADAPPPKPLASPRAVASTRTGSALPVETRPMSASTPSIPKAEETHRLGYRIEGGAAMEVEGVCRFDESSVACWDAGGKPDQAITDRVKAGLDRGPDTSNLQIRYGMKNRILVVRQTTPALVNGQGDRRSLNLMEVGPDPRYGSGGYVQLPEERVQWNPKVPSVRREARLFSVDRDARETRMRVMVSEPMPERAELKLSKGASATLNGVTWRVVSTTPAPERSPSFGMATGKMWTVKVALSGRPQASGESLPATGGNALRRRERNTPKPGRIRRLAAEAVGQGAEGVQRREELLL